MPLEFLETPRFTGRPSFGFVSAPAYRVTRVQAYSGRIVRNLVWEYALRRITVTLGPRAGADVQYVLNFFHACAGGCTGFRFKDDSDFKSCQVQASIAITDQPLTLISGSTYQLYKDYTVGAQTQRRKITKPVANTIRVANQLGVEQSSSHWSLDDTTGILTKGGTFTGTPTTWGGEFDVPVIFDEDELPLLLQDKSIQSASFALQEIRP